MPKMQVRCCCNPALILGLIEWPVRPIAGQRVRFSIFDRPGWPMELDGSVIVQHIDLEVGVIKSDGMQSLAIKSNDVSIETLRRLRQFSEC